MNRSSARRPRSGLHCREAVARPSRSPIGDCYDCAMCESFVRDLKRPGFARCGHLRGRVSQGPMEGRKRKTRVALPSRNVGNDQPSTESGQLHLSSRRQRCDDPLNPPSTRRSRSGCGVARPASSRRWDRWATATTMQCAESFFATLECELLDRVRFRTQSEARIAIFDFIEGFYNPRRRHSALGYLSPIEFERAQAA